MGLFRKKTPQEYTAEASKFNLKAQKREAFNKARGDRDTAKRRYQASGGKSRTSRASSWVIRTVSSMNKPKRAYKRYTPKKAHGKYKQRKSRRHYRR